jgi:hypothetical protein
MIYRHCDNGNSVGERAVDGGVLHGSDIGFDEAADEGCAFILDEGGPCGMVRRAGSPYCEPHHALCHLPGGSDGERRRLREDEVLARVVGGRRGREARTPSDRFLQRLDSITRDLARPSCSRIVRNGDGE